MAVTESMEKKIIRLEHENKELQEQLKEWLLVARLHFNSGLPRQSHRPAVRSSAA